MNTMWCIQCQEDVPALPSGDDKHLCCARCGLSLRFDATDAATALPDYDDWELDEQLRHIGRALQTPFREPASPSDVGPKQASRFDSPHAGAAAWHLPVSEAKQEKKRGDLEKGSFLGALTWSALSAGAAGFLCGGILLVWSIVTGRQELWTVGLPIALGGQITFLIGLVLQIDRLWSDNRKAVVKLAEVDEQLHEIKSATTMLGTSQHSASNTFYSHFSAGAGSKLLLSDLKGQIDLLAMKIARED